MDGIGIPLCQVEKIIAYRKKNVKRVEKKLCGSKRIPIRYCLFYQILLY
jgi:hypothetical protein